MSNTLTNPDKVVTAEMLQEYHESILPYLGGMPSMVANKFDKGNLYSTDERMIGQWIDGKPLYQKVIESETTNFTSSFRKYGTIGVSNISVKSLEYIVVDGKENNYYGQNTMADDEESYAYIEGSTGDFYFKLDKNWTSAVHKVVAIAKYTKANDDPIKIGSDTDYSTEEKIIGTWIDGKPIYQTTFALTSIVTGSDTSLDMTADAVICASITAKANNEYLIFPWGPNFFNVGGGNGNNMYYKTNYSLPSGGIMYVTVQYTKTTN